jgi:tripartite ATP-independent transporter DctP family solute receptor
MKKVKLISVFVVLVLVLSGTAFAGGAKDGSGGKKVINVASTYPAGSPQDLGINRFKEEFEKATNGRYEVLIHPASAMGGERETFEMLEAGSVEIGLMGVMDLIMNYPKYPSVDNLIFFMPDMETFWKYWAGPGKELNDLEEKEHGVRTVGTVFRGARYVTANKPIHSLADARGLKIRLPELKIANDIFSAFGMIPANVAFGDLYMALRTGVVEAQENPPETILNYKFYEVQKYIISTRHILSSARFQVSMKWYNTLSAEDQKTFDAAMKTGVDYANSLTKDGDEEFIKQLVANGMEYIELDTAPFRAIAEPINEDFAKSTMAPGYFEQLQNL